MTPPSGGNGMEMHDGFILFLDESGNKKVLLASEGTFSVVEEVSHQQAQDILNRINAGSYRWLRYGQKRRAGAV